MSELEPSDPPIVRERKRIFGERPQGTDGAKAFTILPLVSEADALQFFQTVPAGVSMAELSERARAYRKEHPDPIVDPTDDDLEPAG